MRNPFKKDNFDDRMTARVKRAQMLAMLPGIIVDEVRAEALLGPHPDPSIGQLALNLPLDYGLFEDEDPNPEPPPELRLWPDPAA